MEIEFLEYLTGNGHAEADSEDADLWQAELANDLRPPRSKELAGHEGHHRLRLGAKYRLVWQVLEDLLVNHQIIGTSPEEVMD